MSITPLGRDIMKEDAWFADEGTCYTGSEPCFYHPGDFAWTAGLLANWQVIRAELDANLASHEAAYQPYMDASMSSRPNAWKTLGLLFWGIPSRQNCERMPETWKLINRIPGVVACSFNLLEPSTTIKPHIGNTDAIVRCHLGLIIPGAVPRCGFRVGAETRSWEEGGLLMFCDAHEHTAWNNTQSRRYVMVLDVFREDFLPHRKRICARVHGEIRKDAHCKQMPWLQRLCRSRVLDQLISTGYRQFSRLQVSR